MLLRLPASLHYPITVTELLKQPNDNVERFAPLFSYVYETKVIEGDNLGNTWQTLKKFPTRFESSIEGVLLNWKISEGAVISKPNIDVADIEEPCAHSVQFGGMCVTCGKDMSESSYVTEQLDSSRATINMVHNNISLTISENEAARADDEAKRRLLNLKKLSLVVDLDQTIIQATVDPTVADWQKDKNNPNHDAVKDVRAFLLKDDGPGNRGCWYYIKLRPGLQNFLENISKIYELHIYTMGTRAYAKNIADIIDPEHKIFGDRILSRDESGSSTAKNLQRLFPVDTRMVVIIDDRGDVWKWSPNLIKVTPYDFFVGIGDINSSFLPKKPAPKASQKSTAIAAPKNLNDHAGSVIKEVPEPRTNGTSTQETEINPTEESEAAANSTSPLEQLVAMGGGDDPAIRQAQTTRQDETLAAQLEDRPLLQKQKQLEAEDAATEATPVGQDGDSDDASPSSDWSGEPDKSKHNLLQDHDRELFQLEKSLRKVHGEFYEIYYRQWTAAQGGRLGQLRGGQKRKLPSDKSDLDFVPDIKDVLPSVKSSILAGIVIVFSGVVPLGVDVGSTDSAILARSFGARIEDNVGKSTTHVVAARNRTQKVRKAIKRGKGRIKIVNPQWLSDSINGWSKVDERPYLLDTEGKNGSHDDDDDILSESESPAASESGEETDNSSRPSKPTLSLKTQSKQSHLDGDESEVEDIALSELDVDEASPVGGTNEDWSGMNDELAEFLGSDVEDSDDGDSVASGDTTCSLKLGMRGKKRGRKENDSGGESDDGGAGKVKKKKKKHAVGNGLTSLSQTIIAQSDGDLEVNNVGDELAGGGVVENGVKRDEEEEEEEEEGGDGWSEFEDELERELEKGGSDDQGEG